MTILLDLDGTALLTDSNGEYYEHPRLAELLKNNDVTLFSARFDVDSFAESWGVPSIWKGGYSFPIADVLIDDTPTNQEIVRVRYYFESIDAYLAFAAGNNIVTSEP